MTIMKKCWKYPSVGKDTDQLEMSQIAGRNAKWWENGLAVSYKGKYTLLWPKKSFLVICSREMKAYGHIHTHTTCTPRFIIALFMRVSNWKQPKHPSVSEWFTNRETPIQRNLTQQQRSKVLIYLCWMKGASLKRLYNVWSHWYDILKET